MGFIDTLKERAKANVKTIVLPETEDKRRIAADTEKGLLKVEDIQAETFENYLYTAGLPAPDLLIRPGGDNRISNFMLWQIAYAEIWTTDAYWPAFTPEMFLQAIKEYQGRERRFGGLVTK